MDADTFYFVPLVYAYKLKYSARVTNGLEWHPVQTAVFEKEKNRQIKAAAG